MKKFINYIKVLLNRKKKAQMESTVLTHCAYIFYNLALRWVAKNPMPVFPHDEDVADIKLWMVATTDVNIPEDIESWPFFYYPQKKVWRYFKEHYPTTRLLVKLDLSTENPESCWERF